MSLKETLKNEAREEQAKLKKCPFGTSSVHMGIL